MNLLEDLPQECFIAVCVNLRPSDLSQLSVCSSALAELCGPTNGELWYQFFCRRLWTVKPTCVIPSLLTSSPAETGKRDPSSSSSSSSRADWKSFYRAMLEAEQKYQRHLDDLRLLDFGGTLERHFVGEPFGVQVNGWAHRYCEWSSDIDAFDVYLDATRRQCFAVFPMGPTSEVKRLVSTEQIQVEGPNPVVETRPYVFTITNTSMPMLWACHSEAQLQFWLNKILVTVYPLKNNGKSYRPPAKYSFQKVLTTTINNNNNNNNNDNKTAIAR